MSGSDPIAVSLVGVLLVVVCSAIEGFAQVYYKKASHAGRGGRRWVVYGTSLFGLEAVLYTVALRFLDLSTAYPLGSLSFVSVTLLSQWMLRERVIARRWIGVLLILVGAAMVVMHG
ncbi:MAG TPA: EamA family transporter [Candidatus Sulfotelmatobacter sp.]|jgi:drug/metabolite transporter (DMT)-like permease|nr:EamA family transporter [Candidatus Sulfotelmatobacter sp.]